MRAFKLSKKRYAIPPKKINMEKLEKQVEEAVERAMNGEDLIFDVPKEDSNEETVTLYELIVAQFEKETGKHAIWGGKETKNFLIWKKKNDLL